MLLVLIQLLLLALLVLLKPIHTQEVHHWVAHQCQTPLPSRWTTFTAEPPSRVRLLLLGCCNKLRPVCLGKGMHTPRLAFPCQTLVQPHMPLGIMVGHTLTLMETTKPHRPPLLTPTPSHYLVVTQPRLPKYATFQHLRPAKSRWLLFWDPAAISL
jgi:hypothetical protein